MKLESHRLFAIEPSMGNGDRRNSRKMRQRKSQAAKKMRGSIQRTMQVKAAKGAIEPVEKAKKKVQVATKKPAVKKQVPASS